MADSASYEGWPEEQWREKMEEHPFFRTQPMPEGQEMPPLIEALQQLKYDPDENTPEELALAYRVDGNENFKIKKFRWAIDSYTKGLEAKSTDPSLNAVLYGNRATAHYHLGNFRKSLNDATEAVKLKPDYLKAFQRGAMCCLKLDEFTDCITWCKKGLKLTPDDRSLLELEELAEDQKKQADRNRRKALVQAAKRKKELEVLQKAFAERGVTLGDNINEHFDLHPEHHALPPVHLDGKTLVWPVILMYPEFQIQDSIQNFREDSSFLEELKTVFSSPPDWDKNRDYNIDRLQLYFYHGKTIVPFEKTLSLREVLSDKRYKVFKGTPEFFVTVRNSKFDRAYRKKYTIE